MAHDSLGRLDGTYVGGVTLGSTNVPTGAESGLRSVAMAGTQYVQLPSTLADQIFRSGEAWTLSYWVRPDVPITSGYGAALSWMNSSGDTKGLLFYNESNGSLDYWVGDRSTWNNYPNYNPGTGLQNAWIHVAASFDGSTLRCYRNGALVKSAAISSFALPDAGRPITLGLRPGSNSLYDLRGRMTDVRFYSGVLTDSQVQTLFTYPGWPAPADNPTATPPTVDFQMAVPNQISLTLPITATWQYQLERSTDLGSWTPVGPSLSAPVLGSTHSFTDAYGAGSKRFYRIRITH